MKHSLIKARAALAALPRCTATSRQTREPCKLPGSGGGGKCRFHGGASTGRSKVNGRRTRKAALERDWIRLMLGCVAITQAGTLEYFRPGRLRPARIKQLLSLRAGIEINS